MERDQAKVSTGRTHESSGSNTTRVALVADVSACLLEQSVTLAGVAGVGRTWVAEQVARSWPGQVTWLQPLRCCGAVRLDKTATSTTEPRLTIIDDAHRGVPPIVAENERVLRTVRAGTDAFDHHQGLLLEVPPLTDDEAEGLIGEIHPDLDLDQKTRVLSMADGRPHLIAMGQCGIDELRLWSRAWIADLAPPDVRVAGVLHACESSIPISALTSHGYDIDGAVTAGVLTRLGGSVKLSVPVAGLVAFEALDPSERDRAFSFALEFGDIAERPFLLAQLGRNHDAQTQAVIAAVSARGERGRDLVDLTVEGARDDLAADDWFAIAIKHFSDGRFELAKEAAERVGDDSPAILKARALVVQGRALWALMELGAAGQCWQQAHQRSKGSRTTAEVESLAELARLAVRVHWDSGLAESLATEAIDLGREIGARVDRALLFRAQARYLRHDAGWHADLDTGARLAALSGDHDAIAESLNVRVMTALWSGNFEESRHHAQQFFDQVEDASLLKAWGDFFRFRLALIDMLSCNGAAARERVEQHLAPRLRRQVHGAALHAFALLADGHVRHADEIIHEAQSRSSADRNGLALLKWVSAEAAWTAGRPDEAVRTIREALAEVNATFPLQPLLVLAEGWACAELGIPRTGELHRPLHGVVGASQDELAALDLMRSEPAAAAGLFERASVEWNGRFEWAAVRCLLGSAECWLAVDQLDRFDAVVARIEVALANWQFPPLAGRLRQLLKRAGRPYAPPTDQHADDPDGQESSLTNSVKETLELSKRGLTLREMAGQLGVSPRTVEQRLEHARLELGARNQTALSALLQTQASSDRRPCAVLIHPGQDVAVATRRFGSDTKIVVAGEECDIADAVGELVAGRFVIVVMPVDETAQAVVLDDLRSIADVDLAFLRARPFDQLSVDQVDLILGLARGATVAEAAIEQHMSKRTAERRLADALHTLGVSDRRAAVQALLDAGFRSSPRK